MELRDKLKERAQPFLEPGEEVQQVFMGQTGPRPDDIQKSDALGSLLHIFKTKPYIIVVTDRGILLLRVRPMGPSKPKELSARLPRATRIGPMSGSWGETKDLVPDKMWIHKRWHNDVAAADAQAAAGGAADIG